MRNNLKLCEMKLRTQIKRYNKNLNKLSVRTKVDDLE